MGENHAGGSVPQQEPQQREPIFYKDNVIYEQFKVIVESKKKDNSNLPYLCKFKVGQAVSSILPPTDIPDFNRISRTKFVVSCKTRKDANALVANEQIQKSYNVYIPAAYVYKFAILKGVDLDFSQEEILENIDARNYKVVNVQRLNRRIPNPDNGPKYVPSTSIKLMIEGQSLPSYIFLYHVKGEIEPYMQNVTQCFKCFKFGHTLTRCKNESKCKQCCEITSLSESHTCQKPISCFHCHGNHPSNSKKDCPEYFRQCNIKKLMMAQPLIFQEAAQSFPQKNQKSYSSKLQSRLELHKFPILQNISNSESSTIPRLVIPLSSAINSPSLPSTSNEGYDFNPNTYETHKRRAPPSKSKTPNKKFVPSRPDPLLNFNSPVMKEQLINSNLHKGANGVCLNNNAPSTFSKESLSPKLDHDYSMPSLPMKPIDNKLKIAYTPNIDFSQSQNPSTQNLNSNETPMDVSTDKSSNVSSSPLEENKT